MGVSRRAAGWAGALMGAALMTAGHAVAAQLPAANGSLSDWGITVKDGNVCTGNCTNSSSALHFNGNGTIYNTGLGATTGFQLQDRVEGIAFGAPGAPSAGNPGGTPRNEDIYDGLNTGLVDPNYGGQNYDAEWMGTALNGTKLSIAILSGVRPDNGFSKFAPGDIRLVAKNSGGGVIAEYGIETGGGKGGVSGDTSRGVGGTSVANDSKGSTYVLDSAGATSKVVNSTSPSTAVNSSNQTSSVAGTKYEMNSGQTAGSIWRMTGNGTSTNCGTFGAWICDPISGADGSAISNGVLDDKMPNQIGKGAVKVGETDAFVYTRNESVDGAIQHSVIELTLDLALLDLGGTFDELDIYWGPACGNDVLHIAWPRPEEVPAPAALWLLGPAGLRLIAMRRRRGSACRN
jgi:hypothetical protein